MTNRHAFDTPVVLEIDGNRFFLSSVDDARECLDAYFPAKTDPSYKRAVETCASCRAGIGTADAARVTLIVAAMAAGYRFEVIEDRQRALELLTEIEVEKGLRSALFDSDGGLGSM
jgi:hypothetical protein